MMVVPFVLVAGLVVGALAYRAGIVVGALAVLIGAGSTALLDAWGILRSATRVASPSQERSQDRSGGLAPDLPRVWWLMVRDTFWRI